MVTGDDLAAVIVHGFAAVFHMSDRFVVLGTDITLDAELFIIDMISLCKIAAEHDVDLSFVPEFHCHTNFYQYISFDLICQRKHDTIMIITLSLLDFQS